MMEIVRQCSRPGRESCNLKSVELLIQLHKSIEITSETSRGLSSSIYPGSDVSTIKDFIRWALLEA